MKKMFLIASGLIIGLSSCSFTGTKGSGHVISKTFSESDFKDIEVTSTMKVFLTQGKDFSVKIEAEDNMLDLMTVKNKGGKLTIDFQENVEVRPTEDILIYITAPEFHDLEASGASSFVSKGVLTGNEIILDLSGATKVNLKLAVRNIKIESSGASKVVLTGVSDRLELDGSGSMDLEAIDLTVQTASLEISGAGNATINAEKELKVSISGAGKVKYKGTPIISKDINGAGSIKQY